MAIWVAAMLLVVVAPVSGAMPRYVILFIGDGMGPEHVKAAAMYANGEEGTLSFEKWPVRTVVTTECAGGGITDSAASATAINCGRKVDKGVISRAIPGDGKDLETLLEYCQKQGKSVGFITTSFITDATPAAFGAHAGKRGDFNDIVSDYLNKTRPNVLMGGMKHMRVSDTAAAGYAVVTTRDELAALDANVRRIAGLFGNGVMPYMTDPEASKYPSLAEMTRAAIGALEDDPDGFFLMVEGGNIDHAAHLNKLMEDVTETIAFADAVAAGQTWATGKDVLLIVTADHETGGLSVVKNNGKGNLPEVKWESRKHTSTPVPLYAWGTGAERLAAVKDNTDIRWAITGESRQKAAEKSPKKEKTEEKSMEPVMQGQE